MDNTIIYVIIIAGCFMVLSGVAIDKLQEANKKIRSMKKQIKSLIDELPQY